VLPQDVEAGHARPPVLHGYAAVVSLQRASPVIRNARMLLAMLTGQFRCTGIGPPGCAVGLGRQRKKMRHAQVRNLSVHHHAQTIGWTWHIAAKPFLSEVEGMRRPGCVAARRQARRVHPLVKDICPGPRERGCRTEPAERPSGWNVLNAAALIACGCPQARDQLRTLQGPQLVPSPALRASAAAQLISDLMRSEISPTIRARGPAAARTCPSGRSGKTKTARPPYGGTLDRGSPELEAGGSLAVPGATSEPTGSGVPYRPMSRDSLRVHL
jgi:hypothetical protein